ncbi:MAG: hypothetical protein H6933_04420 [Burkholderiaceae bacterium]|nr:hypothetical protein [Rhodoferax sp.]MCP5284124.1 hypothetical protein [Burkholderiaceae bacterium]
MTIRLSFRRLVAAFVVLLAAGCAQVSHVQTGDVVLRERMTVTVDKAWNQFERGLGDDTPTWTQDGFTVDALRFYVGLADGELIAPTPSEPKGQQPLAFKSGMRPAQIVALYETYYSRGGSTFTLDKLSPDTFAGGEGFRFEFSSIRKYDEVTLRGIGWGAVRDGRLYVITYTAPRMSFFERHRGSAEAIARSARIKKG